MGKLGYDDTPVLPGQPWRVHDGTRPQPRVVTPGTASTARQAGEAPSDAIVLFDGTDLSRWKGREGPAPWRIFKGGYMQVRPKTGGIETVEHFGDCQLHLELATPKRVKGDSQGRGNSGVFLMGLYEVQVLDGFDNPTYADGQIGGIYGQWPPLVNAARPPGEWQTYDIVFEAPQWEDGRLEKPAYLTVLLNGILLHNRQAAMGPTGHRNLSSYDTPHPEEGPLSLQDHGDLVRFRNIWIRRLKSYDEALSPADAGDGKERPRGHVWPWMGMALLGLLADAIAAPSLAETKSVVSIVRSDYAVLSVPVGSDEPLSYARIRDMVAAATRLGGLEDVVRSAEVGATDTLRVAIKVNIVHAEPNPGDITDWRVVKGVIEAVHALSPGARVTIVEGGVWLPPERTDLIALLPFIEVADGFARAGYRPLLTDPDLEGVDLHIVDLNFDEAVETPVPGGGFMSPTYFMPRTVLEADVFIDVPVLKITGTVGMTVAMKNLIGTAPGMIYGWAKSQGFPPESDNPGLWHAHGSLDETIVDLTAVAGVDFSVVDAVVAMERARIRADGGRPVRMNTIVAGADIVSVDAVCTRLMGMNPADMEFLTLAEDQGLGRGAMADIQTVGQSIEEVGHRFVKYPRDWGETGHYGQGNKLWLLKGPIPRDADTVDVSAANRPRAGADGWSAPALFFRDQTDLDRYYDDPVNSVAYAYAEADVPEAGSAHLWVGSDEGMRVWVNGEQVYDFSGSRRHHLPNDRVPVTLREGTNTCLLRLTQRRGRFEFSFKICEIETDERYDGNAVMGLEWSVPAPEGVQVQEFREARGEQEGEEWWADHGVDLTQPRRAWLTSYLPDRGQAPWIGLVEAAKWGWPMEELTALIEDGILRVYPENLQRFYLKGVGPLSDLGASVPLSVDDLPAVGAALAPGEIVEVEVTLDEEGRSTGWQSRPVTGELFPEQLATVPVALSRSEAPEGYLDAPLGNWFADAIRAATGADIAFQNNGGIRTDLEEGVVEIRHFFRMNFPDEIYQFELTGEELVAVLEHDVRDEKPRPMQVSGLSYQYDPHLPQGERVVRSSLERDRTYAVVAEDYICLRGERFFGREVAHRKIGIHVVDCLVRYAREQGTIEARSEGRIRQVKR